MLSVLFSLFVFLAIRSNADVIIFSALGVSYASLFLICNSRLPMFWLSRIGAYSYSLYLVHQPIIWVVSLFQPGLIGVGLSFIGTVLMGIICWKFLDLPTIQKRYNVAIMNGSIILACCAIIAIIFVTIAKSSYNNDIKASSAEIFVYPQYSFRGVVIGDSHSPFYYELLQKVYPNASLKNINTACLPLPEISHTYSVTNYRDFNSTCILSIQDFEAQDVDIIFVAGRWANPVIGEISDKVEGVWTRGTALINPSNFKPGAPGSVSDRLGIFISSARALAEIKEKKVVFLGQVPPLGSNLGYCHRTLLYDYGLCNGFYTQEEIESRLGPTEKVFKQLSANNPNVHYVNSLSNFCPAEDGCARDRDNVFFYRDDNHLLLDSTTVANVADILKHELGMLSTFILE